MAYEPVDLNKSKKISNPKYEFFGLRLLWEAIQDYSKLDPKLFTITFDSCVKLIKNANFKSEREKYLVLCFDNLKGVRLSFSCDIEI